MKKQTSESKLNLPIQPAITCPMIDNVINSLNGIGEIDENDEIIEIDADLSSLKDALDNAEEISHWINSWIDLADNNLESRLSYIKKCLNEEIEDNEVLEMYHDFEYINDVHYEIKDGIKEGRKEIERLYKNLEWDKDSIENSISNNDQNSISELEDFRNSIVELRETSQHFKDIFKEPILEFLPELSGEETAYEQYLRKNEKKEFSLNWANEKNSQRPNNFHDENYILIEVHIEDITNHMHSSMKLDLHDEKGGENGIGNRAINAKNHFLKGLPMDYPEVGCNDRNNVIDYTNGRHRVVAAFQLGEEYVPMFVYKPTIDKFKSLVRTKNIQNPVIDFLESKKSNTTLKKQKSLKIN